MVSGQVVEVLQKNGVLCAAYNFGPPSRASRPVKLLIRTARTLKAAIGLTIQRLRGASTLYMSTDAQLGLSLNIALATLAKLLNYDVFFHHHNFSYIDTPSSLMSRLIAAAPRGSTHISLCTEMSDRLSSTYQRAWAANSARALTLPNGFLVEAAEILPAREGAFTIGHLSNLSVEKGALRFISLFRRLKEAGHDVRAYIAGPCDAPRIQAEIEAASAEHPGSFIALGPIYGEAKQKFYQRLDVFVFPTTYRNEAQPLVLLEALAQGSAILSIDKGCIGCDHGPAPGAIFNDEAFDQSAFEWVATSINDEHLRRTLGEESRKWFNQQREESLAAIDTLLQRIDAQNTT